MSETITIESVWIELTYPNSIVENFFLKKPREFQFKFRKIPRLPDYKDAQKITRPGNYFYQLLATYNYEWHEMDLRKLLVAEKITLKFPPVFGDTSQYNSADVLLVNDEVLKNYFQGLALASTEGEVVPSGSTTLEFEGVDAFTPSEMIGLFDWGEREGEGDDGDGGGGPEFSSDTFFIMGHNPGDPADIDNGRLYKIKFTEVGALTYDSFFDFSDEGLTIRDEVNSRKTSVSKSGHVLVSARRGGFNEAGTFEAHLFDNDLNYMGSLTLTDYWGGDTRDEHQHYWGENENIYIIQNGVESFQIRKYNQSLSPIWQSGFIQIDGNTTLDVGADSFGMVFFEDRVIVHAYGHSSTTGHSLISIDIQSGNIIDRRNNVPFADISDVPVMARFHDDYFVLGFGDDSLNEGDLRVFNYSLEEVRTCNLGALGTSETVFGGGQEFSPLQAFEDGTICIGNNNAGVLTRFNPLNDTLVYQVEIKGPVPLINHITGDKLLLGNGDSTHHDGLSLLNALNGEALFEIENIYNDANVEEPWSTPASLYEGWELDYFEQTGIEPPPPPKDHTGRLTITSAAQSNDPGVAPSAEIIIRNAPSESSTPCEESGGTKFNIQYELTDYCFQLPASTKSNVATALSGFVSSIPGLGASAGTAQDGDPNVTVTSDNAGLTDEGKRIIFGVPSELEGNGPVFNRYEVFLSGGVEPTSINTPVDIYIGGALFATSAAVTADETATSIAQKIYNACVAVDQDQLEFVLDGAEITINSSIQADLTISLDIGNAGFTYDAVTITEAA